MCQPVSATRGMIHAERENPNPKTKTAQTSFCFTLEFLEMKNWVFGNNPHAKHTKFLKLSETASFLFYIGISEQFPGAERALNLSVPKSENPMSSFYTCHFCAVHLNYLPDSTPKWNISLIRSTPGHNTLHAHIYVSLSSTNSKLAPNYPLSLFPRLHSVR